MMLALSAAATLAGQDSGATLDNEAIVRRVMEGVPEAAVLEAIASAPRVAFDLDPEVVRELRAVGIPEKVLDAMRKRQAQERGPSSPPRAPTPQGRAEIRFARAEPGKKSGERVTFQVIRKTPRWAAEQLGMLQRPEVEDLAFFLVCTRPDHVPDHWQDSTELKDFARHERLLFRRGSHPAKSHGFEVMALDLPGSLDLELPVGDHRLVAGVAVKVGPDWRAVASAERNPVEIRTDRSASLVVRLTGKVVGSHMTGFKEEQAILFEDAPAPETAP